jgi:hypothetical protein
VKLSSLRKMNGLAEGAEVRAGEVLALRKKQ